jgi:hypothetical protein
MIFAQARRAKASRRVPSRIEDGAWNPSRPLRKRERSLGVAQAADPCRGGDRLGGLGVVLLLDLPTDPSGLPVTAGLPTPSVPAADLMIPNSFEISNGPQHAPQPKAEVSGEVLAKQPETVPVFST